MNTTNPTGTTNVRDFYTDVVLPALADRLDEAFPEFGWRRDPRGWVATNQEMTHRVLGARAERVIAHGPAPRGFLIYGGDATLWTAYLNNGDLPRGREFASTVRQIAQRAGVETTPIDRPQPRDRRADLLEHFFTCCRAELASAQGKTARSYLEQRGITQEHLATTGLGVIPRPRETTRLLQVAGYSK